MKMINSMLSCPQPKLSLFAIYLAKISTDKQYIDKQFTCIRLWWCWL